MDEDLDSLTLEQAMRSVAPEEYWGFLDVILVEPGESAYAEEIIEDYHRNSEDSKLLKFLKQAPFHVFWVKNPDLESCRLIIVDKRPLAATYAVLNSI